MAEEINERPVLKIKWMLLDYVIEIIAALLLISIWLYVIISYQNLPDTIAIHFNFNGEADGYSSKSGIWAMPIVGTALWMLLSIINQFPHSFNFPYKLNAVNIELQYRMAQRFMRFMKVWICSIFLYAAYSIKESSMNSDFKSNSGIFAILFSMIIFMGIYFYFARKNK
jgi:uncharacterized membrane protein